MNDQPKTPGAMVIVSVDDLHRIADRIKFNCPNLSVELQQIVASSVEETPAVGGEPVGRLIEPGPRYKGVGKYLQMRSYAEYSKQSLLESNGYWLEGEPVYGKSYVAPLLAELHNERLAAADNFKLTVTLEASNKSLRARIADLEARLANKNN